jgi:hypothetical protein
MRNWPLYFKILYYSFGSIKFLIGIMARLGYKNFPSKSFE